MLKRLKKWFDKDPLSDVNPVAVVTPEPTLVPAVPSIEEQERQMGISSYQLDELKILREFLKILNQKEIIGWKNNLPDEDDKIALYMYFKTYYSVTFYASDHTEFNLRLWDALNIGTMHCLSFSAVEVTTSVAQGHFFDDPIILHDADRKLLINENLSSVDSDYIKSVMNQAVDNVKEILEGLPIMEEQENMNPVFHKLWEQMDLPLDTNTKIAKL